jgi:DNA-binding transcriptional LysR family regulator
MNLQHLRYFVAIAKYKSFSSASKSLHVSQPAISKSITFLEGYLNTILFERTYQGVKLTKKGMQLYQRIVPVLEQLDDAIKGVTEIKEYRIGTLPSIASYYLPNQLSKISSCQFQTLTNGYSEILIDMVCSGEIDAAIVQSKNKPSKLHCLELIEDPYFVAMRKDHPLVQNEQLKLEEVMNHPIVLQQAPCDIRDDILEGCMNESLQINIAIESPIESILGYTVSGFGLSFVPAMVASQISYRDIVYRTISDNPLYRQIVLISRSSEMVHLFRPIL